MSHRPPLTPPRVVPRTIAACLLMGLALESSGCGIASSSPPAESLPAEADCCKPAGPAQSGSSNSEDVGLARMVVPESHLTDQDGRPVELVRDLIGNRVAAIQFIFTRCATTCPILGNQFGQVRTLLGDQMAKDFALISITVDPEYDRPEFLKDWGRRYGVGPGWSLVTAPKPEMDELLKRLGTSSADRQNHQSQVLVLDGMTSQGLRTSGLASPAELVEVLHRVRAARVVSPAVESRSESNPIAGVPGKGVDAAERYFTNTPLVDQSGVSHRFYGDLLRGKVVVINVFFSQCNGSCVAMGNTLAKLQERLGDRLERDVRLISITVDSPNDTPGVLTAYAKRYNARKGWYFLSGAKVDVDTLLKKLGQYVEVRENHGAVMLVGNMRTGLWKKLFGLADAELVIEQIQTVIDDKAG
jgi:protein SCO1/2